jgi:hypothetical protein
MTALPAVDTEAESAFWRRAIDAGAVPPDAPDAPGRAVRRLGRTGRRVDCARRRRPEAGDSGLVRRVRRPGSPVPEVGGLSIDPAWVDVPGFGGQAIAKDVGRHDSTIVWSRPDRILVEMSNVCAVDPAPIG